ncbi:MAG TPA: NepR family anti-sigma factor [Xanthobacteraceae bacterium]|nr:NepR family anti-sigma factor [Xanthobacteraceae bacterium]
MKDTKAQPPRPKGGLNSEIQARIGHQLRAMYDDVVKQGVPERFAVLLRQMDPATAGSVGGAGAEAAAHGLSADEEGSD